MEGDVEDMSIVRDLYGGVSVSSGWPVTKKHGHPYSAKSSSRVETIDAETNTSKVRNNYIKNSLHVSPYVTYRAQVILTTVKPTLQEYGFINSMSKDTRYFAQTLRKYPLYPKAQTKSSDLIQEKTKRTENKTVSAYRKTSKKRKARKAASQQVIKSNVEFEYNEQDTQRLSKVEEILPTATKVENNRNFSGSKVMDYEYNYLNSKSKLSSIDVRYCTSTKRACTCRRMRNVVCTRPENCPNVQHRLGHHRQFHHDKEIPSCHCIVCQESREAPSTSHLSASEYRNRQEQEEEVQIQSNNYLESSHDAIDFEKEIKKWTEAKVTNNSAVQIKLIKKLAKALDGFSKDKGFLPEARHEVVKYLKALSVLDPSLKDKLDHFADELLTNISKSVKYTKSLKNIANNNSNREKSNLSLINDHRNNNELKMFIKHFLNQLPIDTENTNNDQLDTVAQKVFDILQENKIKQMDLRDNFSTDQYREKDYFTNQILSWYNSVPELKQKLHVQMYDNIIYFQDLGNKLSELNKSSDLKENIENINVEIMQWLEHYLNLHNISYTESVKENLRNKLVTKLTAPTEEKVYYKGLPEKGWIIKQISLLLKDTYHDLHQKSDILELANSLVIHLSYMKEGNNGSLTLHHCAKEIKSWIEYIEEKHNVFIKKNEKMELKCKILSRIKVLLRHEKHKNWYHLKRLRLLTKVILQKLSRSVIENNINMSQEKILNLITGVISLVFETCLHEKMVSKSVYEKVCTILHSIQNFPADDIKYLVKSILDKIISSWKNIVENHSKEYIKMEDDVLLTKNASKKACQSQYFLTSTPRHSEERFPSNFYGDSTDFSNLMNENFLQKVIKDWLEENQIRLNETEKQNIIKLITSDIVCRYNYAKAFSKTVSNLEEVEHLKYFIFKVLGDYLKEQEISNVISTVSKLHRTIDKTFTSDEILREPEVNNINQVSLEVLKSNLVKAFMNINSYIVDERFKNEYKGKLKEEINKFCSQYFQRLPATPLDTDQLHCNIYDALDNVPRQPLSQSELNIVSVIKSWLDELCKENNLPNNDNENIVLDLVNPLLQKNIAKSIAQDDENELSKTISQWVQNYSKKQNILINGEYWTQKLVKKLKAFDTFQEHNLSKGTSAHMYTIPAAESFGAQIGESIMQSEDNNEILAKDLLSADDRELLSRIKDRSPVPDAILNSQTDFIVDKPDHELVPDIHVREYHWESNEQPQPSRNSLPPDMIDELPPEILQPRGLDHRARTTFADSYTKKKSNESNEGNVDETMIPEKLKNTKSRNKTCRIRKRSLAITEPKFDCPNKFTLKSKSFDKDVSCVCSDCVINKQKITYYCKKTENVDLKNCPECFGGYCPFPSCVYFE